VAETVVIDRRFRGPSDSANGGYACGVLARRLDGAVEVTLRSPPPLEEALQVTSEESGLALRQGDALLAEARRSELDLKVPDTVSLDEAVAASQGSRVFGDHPYRACFGCGPERTGEDGLRLFPGPIAERGIAACAWTPYESLADGAGHVPAEIVWVALDCPTSWGGDLRGEKRPSMLGRLTGEIMSPIESWRTADRGGVANRSRRTKVGGRHRNLHGGGRTKGPFAGSMDRAAELVTGRSS
jgi:hypothetical protein